MPTEVLWWLVAFLLAVLVWVFFLRPDATVHSVADSAKCVHCGYHAPAVAEFCPRCGELVRYKDHLCHPGYAPFQNGTGGIIVGTSKRYA
jgi:predicted RNA-binding Zn-ribbon protein involved in translation (DUF1610 family)